MKCQNILSDLIKCKGFYKVISRTVYSVKTITYTQLDSGSGGRISWDQNSFFHEVEFMRSNFFSFFMRSKFLIIGSISWSALFSWDRISNKSIIRQFRSHDRFVSCKYDYEVEIQKSIIRNFDLMIDLLVISTIMRSKFKINFLI